jgi:aldose 1-epimerase
MAWSEHPHMLALVVGICLSVNMQAQTKVSKQTFGKTPDGASVEIYTLNDGMVETRIMTYGGIVVSVKVPDRSGKLDDVALGYDSLDKYLANPPYLGAIIGRYANRIANGAFQLDGKTYSVPKNNGENSLHGGTRGFDKVVWSAKEIENGVELNYASKDGDQGYPGNLNTTVRYTLTGGALRMEYSAATDKPTVVNLTNHTYFNLAGEGSGPILQQLVEINASRFTPINSKLIPTGELKDVAGTPFDFRTPHRIGERIDANDEQLRNAKGYDHNFVIDRKGGGDKLEEVARAEDPTSGRILQVLTTEPGVQFYSGNFLTPAIVGKQGHVYDRRTAFCFETQHFPDSPNHPNFPSTTLRPGETYHSITVFQFSRKADKK